MNEEKKTSKGIRINILDVVLILLAILCIVGIWQRNNLQKLFASDKNMEDYAITFEISRLPSSFAGYLGAGTELYVENGDDLLTLGTLGQQATTGAATAYLYTAGGQSVEALYHPEDLLMARGTLSARGITHDGGFLLGGKMQLSVNQVITAYTELADFEIRITGIQKLG